MATSDNRDESDRELCVEEAVARLRREWSSLAGYDEHGFYQLAEGVRHDWDVDNEELLDIARLLVRAERRVRELLVVMQAAVNHLVATGPCEYSDADPPGLCDRDDCTYCAIDRALGEVADD